MNITLKNINFIYNPGTVNEFQALKNISFSISEGEFIALAGNTGSGKSTLIQLLNALKLPSSGEILYDGNVLENNKKALRDIRCKVGLVFQYPEYQLFDETVLKDVSFGPRNQGLSKEQAKERALQALSLVGLEKEIIGKSPFDLSGGEKRRAAIAGIIAMQPEVLILDEPTAGLDPAGKIEILNLIKEYQVADNRTVIMVSHNMDEIAEYADRLLVMSAGELIMDGDPHDIFMQPNFSELTGLEVPQISSLCQSLGLDRVITLKEASAAIAKMYM